MSIDADRALQILADLGGLPAVSYHEGLVSDYVNRAIDGLGLHSKTDQYGNVIVRVQGTIAGVPPIAFMAHMDHPGFEAVEVREGALVAEARGGVPPVSLTEPAAVEIVERSGARRKGRLGGPVGAPEDRRVLVHTEDASTVPLPAAVVFDLVDFERRDDLLHMRAADDLAGCGAILAALHGITQLPVEGDVYGVFTRAEEIGLVGARLMAQEHSLPNDCLVVSLESSRELPGAVQGSGPVVRVGDATFTFSAEAEQVLHVARRSLLERDPGAKVQRQLMSGGTCEASGFAAFGYATTGIAFPLGNYHNATPEGGIGSEYIHMDDYLTGVRLVEEAARSVRLRRTSPAWTRLAAVPAGPQARLRRTASPAARLADAD